MKIVNYGSMNIDNVYSVEHMARPGETISPRAAGVLRRQGPQPVHRHRQGGRRSLSCGHPGRGRRDAAGRPPQGGGGHRLRPPGRGAELAHGHSGGRQWTKQHHRLWRGEHAAHGGVHQPRAGGLWARRRRHHAKRAVQLAPDDAKGRRQGAVRHLQPLARQRRAGRLSAGERELVPAQRNRGRGPHRRERAAGHPRPHEGEIPVGLRGPHPGRRGRLLHARGADPLPAGLPCQGGGHHRGGGHLHRLLRLRACAGHAHGAHHEARRARLLHRGRPHGRVSPIPFRWR